MRLKICCFLLLWGAGCSLFHEKPPIQIHNRETIHSWLIEGRISIHATTHQSMQGQLSWQQKGDNFNIKVKGPFGQGGINIVRHNSEAVQLITSEGKFTTQTPEVWMEQQFGWFVPLKALSYWVRGLAVPDVPLKQQLNEQGYIKYLEQNQWKIQFKTYHQVQGVWLPKKIFIKHPQLTLRLVIDLWQLT